MIESVHFENFKSLRDVELRGLQRLNVLVGPSGVGKTSVLQGLELVSDAMNGDLGLPDPRLRTIGTRKSAIEVRSDLGGKFLLEMEGSDWVNDDEYDEEAASDFGAMVLLALDVRKLGSSSISSSTPKIAPDGAGLSSMLAFLAGGYRDRIELIESDLCEVIGTTGQIRTFPAETEVEETEVTTVNGVSFPRVTRRAVPAHRFEVQIDGVGWVPSDLLSEGILVTLGLLAVLHQPDCPRSLLLDDIDKGLHPSAQAKLIAGLRSLLDAKPDVQIIGTSHSPYLLDQFQPEEVQVMSFVADGEVAAARLDTHPEWLEWKGSLQTGEFWSSVGEDWVSNQQ